MSYTVYDCALVIDNSCFYSRSLQGPPLYASFQPQMTKFAMDRFVRSIKQKYKERLINREKQWPLCHSNKLIKLELVELEKGKGYFPSPQRGVEDEVEKRHTFLAYSDLFKVDSGQAPVRKVLVEGDAGIGKTTLCTAISEDWAKESLFQQFELVLLLPLRYKEIALAGSLSELLKLLHSSANIRDSVVNYLEEEEGEKVLVIADGWDELGESERQEDSFLFSLFFKQFPLLSVILTSRPYASALFHRLPYIDRFVAVCDFSYEDVELYIQSEFDGDHDKAERLLQELTNNPLVESICSIPLNCAIVCHLWRTVEKALPTTMTGLYTKIIFNILFRNIQKIEKYKHIGELSRFDALPEGLKESWLLLCEFAFCTMEAGDQIVFSQQELLEYFPQGLDEKVLHFGLLQCTETIFETGRKTAFHFLHLTFQEYLAALYLAKQPTGTQLQFFQSMSADKFDHFSIVLVFYFGIANTESGEFIYQLTETLCPTIAYIDRYAIPLCHFAFEAASQRVTEAVISSLSVQGSSTYVTNEAYYAYDMTFGEPTTAHDCAAMIYILANVQGKSKIAIEFKNADITEKQVNMLTDILSDKRSAELQVTYLNIDHNDLTDECVSDLFSRASAAFSNSLVVLSMSGNNIRVDGIKSIAKALEEQSSGLSILNLSDNPLGVSGLQVLQSLISGGCLANLVDLNLRNADSNGEVIGPLLETLSTGCAQLQALDISDNNVQDDYKSVMSGLSILGSSHKLNKLNIGLKRLNVDDNGLNVFVESLGNLTTSSYCSFESVDLKGNSIHEVGISYLARAKNINVETLSLADNPLGIQGAQAIGELLSSNGFRQLPVLHMLKLSRCQLASLTSTDSKYLDETKVINSVVRQLNLLPQNNTIRVLYLDGNRFTEQGVYILAGFIQLCSCLVYLSTRECGITSDDLGQLFDWLSQHKISSKSLGEWCIASNDVDDKGAYFLIEHMPSLFPHLLKLYAPYNKISNHAMTELTKKLQSKVHNNHDSLT